MVLDSISVVRLTKQRIHEILSHLLKLYKSRTTKLKPFSTLELPHCYCDGNHNMVEVFTILRCELREANHRTIVVEVVSELLTGLGDDEKISYLRGGGKGNSTIGEMRMLFIHTENNHTSVVSDFKLEVPDLFDFGWIRPPAGCRPSPILESLLSKSEVHSWWSSVADSAVMEWGLTSLAPESKDIMDTPIDG